MTWYEYYWTFATKISGFWNKNLQYCGVNCFVLSTITVKAGWSYEETRSTRRLVQVHVSTLYTSTIASSPGPFPAFQCCPLFSMQHWKAGNGPGDEAKSTTHGYLHVYASCTHPCHNNNEFLLGLRSDFGSTSNISQFEVPSSQSEPIAPTPTPAAKRRRRPSSAESPAKLLQQLRSPKRKVSQS